MPTLDQKHIEVLSPLILPFERSQGKTLEKDILEGEGHNHEFIEYIHDGRDNHNPKQYVEITIRELEEQRILQLNSYREKCFLWVIDDVSIKIIWEGTRNILRSSIGKPFVCHTNITGCSRAYIGGEMYFCENGYIYVNFKSDRYGRPETQEKKEMVKQYMQEVGYKNIILLDFI